MFDTINPDHCAFAQSERSRTAFMFEIVHSEVFNIVEVLLPSVSCITWIAQVSQPVQVSWQIARMLAV